MPYSPNPNDENQQPEHEQPETQETVGEEDATAPEPDMQVEAEETAEEDEIQAEEAPADPAQALEARLGELKDQLLRSMAETENVRRRAARDVEEAGKYAVSNFARDMITVGENLFLALQNIPEEAREEEGVVKALADGVEMTFRELLGIFEKHGIHRIDPVGEKFDHNLHQAISQVEDPTKEPGTVMQVVQAGYTLQGRLLRPAMVVVTKRGETQQKVDTQA